MAHETSFKGSWVGVSAGGCFNFASWRCNPQLFISADKPGEVSVSLVQKKSEHHIGFYVAKCSGDGRRVLEIDPDDVVTKAPFLNSEEVSASFVVADPEQTFVLIPCTFKKGQVAPFRLIFKSDAILTINSVKPENEYRISSLQGKWEGSTAGGCKNNPTVADNPQFSLEAKRGVISITLSQTEKEDFDSIGLYVCKVGHSTNSRRLRGSTGPNSLGPGLSPVVGGKKQAAETHDLLRINKLSSKQIVAKSEFSSAKEAFLTFRADPKFRYVVLPCTFEPGHESSFQLTCFSRRRIKFKSLNDKPNDIATEGQWHGDSSGGCVNYPTWRNNPQYFLYLKHACEVQISLTQKRSVDLHSIGLYVARNSTAESRLLVLTAENLLGKTRFEKKREVSLNVTLEADTGNPYVIIPATFHQNKNSKFEIKVKIIKVVGTREGAKIRASSVAQLLPCTFLWSQRSIKGKWSEGESGGCKNNSTWLRNPQINMKLGASARLVIIMYVKDAKDSVGFYLVKDIRMLDQSLKLTSKKQLTQIGKSPFRKDVEVFLESDLEKGQYKVILATFHPGIYKEFEIVVYADTDQFTAGMSYSNSEQHLSKMRQSSKRRTKWGEVDASEVKINAESLLGQGGYGVVYKGTYHGKVVAVKKMLVELMEKEDLETFQKEVNIMDEYHHDNIVKFLGANLEPPNICIVLEFCSRGSLSKVLKLEKNLSWKKKLSIGVDICSGMAYLHSQKPPVVHRDLKSLNVLIMEDYTAKLCDFGMSKTTSGSSLNSCVGSLNWCAPEVLLHNAPFSKKADVYSMGMVFYELYTHSPPFTGMRPLQIIQAIDKGTVMSLPTSCPRSYAMLVKQCLDQKAKNRPEFEDLIVELHKIKPNAFPKKKN